MPGHVAAWLFACSTVALQNMKIKLHSATISTSRRYQVCRKKNETSNTFFLPLLLEFFARLPVILIQYSFNPFDNNANVCACLRMCVCLCKLGCVLFVSFVFAFAWRLTNECRWKRILCQWTESSQLSLSILFLSSEYANFNGNDKSLNIRDCCLVWIRSSLGMGAYEISINHSPTPNCWFRFS